MFGINYLTKSSTSINASNNSNEAKGQYFFIIGAVVGLGAILALVYAHPAAMGAHVARLAEKTVQTLNIAKIAAGVLGGVIGGTLLVVGGGLAWCLKGTVKKRLPRPPAPIPHAPSPKKEISSPEKEISSPKNELSSVENEISSPQNEASSTEVARFLKDCEPGMFSCERSINSHKYKSYFKQAVANEPLPDNIESIISKPCPFGDGTALVKDTHVLAYIPPSLEEAHIQGWSLNRPSAVDLTVGGGYWALIPKAFIPGMDVKTEDEQKQALGKVGYQRATTVEALVYNAMEFKASGFVPFKVDSSGYGDNVHYDVKGVVAIRRLQPGKSS